MDMILASRDLWGLVDELEKAPPSTADVNNKKASKKPLKTTFGIIAINLVDKDVVHIKHCKRPTER